MSAKASIRTFLPEQSGSRLFKWVAILTGSKNALKGAGFFIGATLLQFLQFRGALLVLSGFLLAFLLLALLLLPSELGKTRAKTRFKQIFSRNAAINWLSAARFFLFGARDIWFVVALPVYLYEVMDWKFAQVGSFFALWIIGYGIVQASAPALLRRSHAGAGPDSQAALFWSCVLFGLMLLLVGGFYYQPASTTFLIIGLGGFALIFAINSAVHSFLIVNWSEHDRVALNVGFYYMSNAAGRLAGTVLSGLLYQYYSLLGCLIASAVFVAMTALMSMKLKRHRSAAVDTD